MCCIVFEISVSLKISGGDDPPTDPEWGVSTPPSLPPGRNPDVYLNNCAYSPPASLVLKNSVCSPFPAGVIDQDYRGNVGVILFNFGEEEFTGKEKDNYK